MDITQSNVTPQGKLLTAYFKTREDAERAYQATVAHGYNREEIDIIISDSARDKYFSEPGSTDITSSETPAPETKTLEGLGVGSAVGVTIGALAAAITAVGTSVVLPGLGILVAGPIAAGLVGAGAGSLTGGLVGALVGSGIPEENARDYEANIKSGGILLAVNPHSDQDKLELESEWKKYRAEKIYH